MEWTHSERVLKLRLLCTVMSTCAIQEQVVVFLQKARVPIPLSPETHWGCILHYSTILESMSRRKLIDEERQDDNAQRILLEGGFQGTKQNFSSPKFFPLTLNPRIGKWVSQMLQKPVQRLCTFDLPITRTSNGSQLRYMLTLLN